MPSSNKLSSLELKNSLLVQLSTSIQLSSLSLIFNAKYIKTIYQKIEKNVLYSMLPFLMSEQRYFAVKSHSFKDHF